MSNEKNKSNRGVLTAVLLLVIAGAAYFISRPATDEQPAGTAEDYVAALQPVIDQARQFSGSLEPVVLDQEAIHRIASLEDAWAKVRTGPGYDRQKHDTFIIAFSRYVTGLKSAGMLSAHLNGEDVVVADLELGRKTELMFVVQSLYGVETSAQLLNARELSVDELLSQTNLFFEVTNSLAKAPATLANAVQRYEELKQAPPVP